MFHSFPREIPQITPLQGSLIILHVQETCIRQAHNTYMKMHKKLTWYRTNFQCKALFIFKIKDIEAEKSKKFSLYFYKTAFYGTSVVPPTDAENFFRHPVQFNYMSFLIKEHPKKCIVKKLGKKWETAISSFISYDSSGPPWSFLVTCPRWHWGWRSQSDGLLYGSVTPSCHRDVARGGYGCAPSVFGQ